MRMLGAMAASSVLLEGKMFTASASKSLGLIDEICEEAELLTKAKAWILTASDAETTKAWDNKGFKVPGGGPYLSLIHI